jgi:hypothetical protein
MSLLLKRVHGSIVQHILADLHKTKPQISYDKKGPGGSMSTTYYQYGVGSRPAL